MRFGEKVLTASRGVFGGQREEKARALINRRGLKVSHRRTIEGESSLFVRLHLVLTCSDFTEGKETQLRLFIHKHLS